MDSGTNYFWYIASVIFVIVLAITQSMLIGLKAFKLVTFSWPWALSPALFVFGVFIAFGLTVAITGFIRKLIKK